mmetsp:Transcript_17048/g.47997  ORF Transcript_17048/g.47997 Transcript_17048/m.47997 type:complete len:310 (-) Transcript_17048:147-1076(-)
MAMPGRDILDDLCMRFILNVPSEELRSFERMLFQVEQAHWYYEDFVRLDRPELRSLHLRDFAQHMFKLCPALRAYHTMLDDIYRRFSEYKQTVPTMGGILLDEGLEHCLLVKGPKASSTWGFPKGKKDQGERDIDCAAREVLEETSLDVSSLLAEENSIEVHMAGQRSRLFIVPGIDKQTPFAPMTRGEISEYAWFPVRDLPVGRDATNVLVEQDGSRHKFYKIVPFVPKLKAWIKQRKKKKKKGPKQQQQQQQGQQQQRGQQTEQQATAQSHVIEALRKQPAVLHPWSNFRFDVEAIMCAMDAAMNTA